jgi:integrase
MRQRRARGTGSIEGTGDGRFRGRMPGRGDRLEVCGTYEDAQKTLDAARALVDGGLARAGDDTLVGFGLAVLEQREVSGGRDGRTESSRWRTHVAPFFSGRRLTAVRAPDVVEFRDHLIAKLAVKGRGHRAAPTRRISRSMVQNVLNLLRAVLAAAKERGRIKTNPAADVRLPRRRGATHEPWTYLLPAEQRALLVCASPRQAPLIAFALGTGLREGEVWNLELADVDLAANGLTVRYGSKGKPRKNGKVLRAEMLPMARAGMLAQLEQLKRDAAAHEKRHPGEPFNQCGLAWPNSLGSRRSVGEPSWWPFLLRRVGLTVEVRHDRRAVRWHDLRHTCASSLVAGWWGRRWSLEEVRGLLGHSSIVITQRYAHLADSALNSAVRETSASMGLKTVPRDYDDTENLSHLGDLNPRPAVYESLAKPAVVLDFRPAAGTTAGLGERAAEALRDITEGRWRRAVDLLTEIAADAATEATPTRSAPL